MTSSSPLCSCIAVSQRGIAPLKVLLSRASPTHSPWPNWWSMHSYDFSWVISSCNWLIFCLQMFFQWILMMSSSVRLMFMCTPHREETISVASPNNSADMDDLNIFLWSGQTGKLVSFTALPHTPSLSKSFQPKLNGHFQACNTEQAEQVAVCRGYITFCFCFF